MIGRYLKKYKVLLIISLILTFFQSASMLYQPEIISKIINNLSQTSVDQNLINDLGIRLIIIGLIGLIAGVINTVVSAKVSQSIGSDIREDGFRNVQKLNFEDIEKFTTSNLVVRLTNDINQIQIMLMMGLQLLVRVPMLFFGAFILAVLALPSLWWTIILYVVVVFLLVGSMSRLMVPKFFKIQKSIENINTTVKENIDGVRVVKSFVTEKQEKEKFDEQTDQLTDNIIYVGKTFSIMIPALMFTANLLIGFAIYFVSKKAVNDPELIGSLVSFMTYVMQIMFAIIMGAFVMMSMSRAIVSMKRVGEVLDAKPSFTFGDEILKDVDTISFDHVYFKYPNEEDYALEDITFSCHTGEKVGIVGATGSGKTTLVQLIPRLYDVKSGSININGKNINKYTSKSLRENIAIVLQKAHLFSGTIKSVILEGNKDAKDLDVEMAAKRSQAYEFIQKKDEQFESEVYQKGSNFSGGQKQRLSIARGLVKDPHILILDDSTSALDAKSENLVKEAINTELKGVTTFIVAQKISSVVDLDKIIVLEKGKIDGIGTHAELLKTSLVYKEIYDTQKGKEV